MNNYSEGDIQDGISAALTTYFERTGMQYTQRLPYSNQQGMKFNQYCADLVGYLPSSFLILLEIKYLEYKVNLLRKFDSRQHYGLVVMERLGVPIAYAYNNVPTLSYHNVKRSAVWYVDTLQEINRTRPTLLPNKNPCLREHRTLYEWIRESIALSGGDDNFKKFAEVLGLASANQFRNGVLVLFYSVKSNSIGKYNVDDLKRMAAAISSMEFQKNHGNARMVEFSEMIHAANQSFLKERSKD